MSTLNDEYAILELSPGANLNQVKKAYKKLALKYHPDKQRVQHASLFFRVIKQAYDTLISILDPSSRSEPSGQHRRTASPAPPEADSAYGSGSSSSAGAQRERPTTRQIPISLDEVLKGATRKHKITRTVVDVDGNEFTETKELKVLIKPGDLDGTVIVYAGEGDRRRAGGPPADLQFILQDKPNSVFKRISAVDLLFICTIHYDSRSKEPIKVCIPTLDSGWLTETIGNVHKEHRIVGRGLPYVDEPSKRGDIVVQFKLITPPKSKEELEAEAAAALEASKKCKNEPINMTVFITLFDVLNGTEKWIPIKRSVIDENENETTEEVEVQVIIPRAAIEGQEIIKLGEGHRGGEDSLPGDLVFKLKIEEHPTFARDNTDLFCSVTIDYKEALLPTYRLSIPTLDGDSLIYPLPLTVNTDLVTVRNRGLPLDSSSRQRGSLVVQLSWLSPDGFQEYAKAPKEEPITRPLYTRAEERQSGVRKIRRYLRKVVLDTAGTDSLEETLELSIELARETKLGTRIIFACEGDRSPEKVPADWIFTIKDVDEGDASDDAEDDNSSKDGQSAAAVYKVAIPLEQVANGGKRKLRFIRRVAKETEWDDNEEQLELTELLLDIVPGTAPGTKIAFPGVGHRQTGTETGADVVLVFEDAPHGRFRRLGEADLLYTIPLGAIPEEQPDGTPFFYTDGLEFGNLTMFEKLQMGVLSKEEEEEYSGYVELRLLDGRKITFALNSAEAIKAENGDREWRYPGNGLPRESDPKVAGDLIIRMVMN